MEAFLISINFRQMLLFIFSFGTRNHPKRRESICRLNEFESDKEKISVYQMSDDREVGFQPTEQKKESSMLNFIITGGFETPRNSCSEKVQGFLSSEIDQK